jgi:ribokinase
MQKPIVVVGSINMDLVASAEYIPSVGETIKGTGFQFQPGGKGANQAVAVAKLGYPVRMVGKVGDDLFGTQLLNQLKESGVDTAGVAVSSGSSGIALVVVSHCGENSIVVIPGANATVTPEFLEQKRDIICSAGLVLAQLEIPIETVEHLALMCERENIPLILDPAPARPLSRRLLESVAWFTPNETEAAFFAGGDTSADSSSSPDLVTERLFEKGVRRMVLKLGDRGAFLVTGADNQLMLKSAPVCAIDTTGAGDAFNGAFATGLLQGYEPFKSARFAIAAAAVSVTRVGAQASMASMEEVQELLERGQDALDK